MTPRQPQTGQRLILVTGANGFVGKPLCERLAALAPVRALVRTPFEPMSGYKTNARIQWVNIDDLCSITDWRDILDGIKIVVHLAARTHVLRESDADPLAAYRRINVLATENLALACASAGVRRLVFLSSIKVNGEFTVGQPFCESDSPRPEDAYGISKWEAELALSRIAKETGLEVVIVRPPLVYGPGVKGNFLKLLDIARRGWPLPLGSVHNLRSFIYVENLVAALTDCAMRAEAAGNTYLVSDGTDVSTPELIEQLSSRLGARAKLWRCPPRLLYGAATLAGRGAEASRLLGSLQVDSSLIRTTLRWTPPFTAAQGLDRTAQWYHQKVN